MSREQLFESRDVRSESELVESLLDDLGLTLDDMDGKKVLDVGAGHALVGELARARGIDITSLDRNPGLWTDEGNTELPDVPYVQGDAAQLPFHDEQFDLIIDRAGPLEVDVVSEREQTAGRIREVIRVLRPGGELRLGPAFGKPDALEFLQGIDAHFEQRDNGLDNRKMNAYYVLKK